MAKVSIKNETKGVLVIKPKAGSQKKPFNLVGGKKVQFDSVADYEDFAPCCSAFVQAGLASVKVSEAKEKAPEEPESSEKGDKTTKKKATKKKAAGGNKATKKTTKKASGKKDESKKRLDEIRAKLKELKAEYEADGTEPERQEAIKVEVTELKAEAEKLK